MKGRWLPLPMATFSQPQKWSNSRTQALVLTQNFVRGPFSTHVVVHRRSMSASPEASRERIISSTPDARLGRGGTVPGSSWTVTRKSARVAGTPSSNARATYGAALQLASRMSVRYWKEARDTLTNQKVAAALCANFTFRSAAGSFLGLRRSSEPIACSASPRPSAWPGCSRSCRRALLAEASDWSLAKSRTLRPWASLADGSTFWSRRNSKTLLAPAVTARCSGVMRSSSTVQKSASKYSSSFRLVRSFLYAAQCTGPQPFLSALLSSLSRVPSALTSSRKDAGFWCWMQRTSGEAPSESLASGSARASRSTFAALT
mmetsp:Transcript_84226/g.223117  ORF Transcript_84226/g.223117 Transcript_84226/m.223117 type:complete len:318 (+) Transcript_84226:492-1445(+)